MWELTTTVHVCVCVCVCVCAYMQYVRLSFHLSANHMFTNTLCYAKEQSMVTEENF